MSVAPTVDDLYASAKDFAHEAIAAHRDRKARRTAVNAGTSLEHLAKACLVQRSAGLLADVRQGDPLSLIRLLNVGDLKPSALGKRPRLRTIGMRDAIARAEMFIDHTANSDDMRDLYDLRDGVIHAAVSTDVDNRVMVAFATVTDAFLNDLGKDRADFWANNLDTLDALLSKAATQVERDVEFAFAAARARLAEVYGPLPDDVRDRVMDSKELNRIEFDQELIDCPNCHRQGIATGFSYVEWGDLIEHDADSGQAIYSGDPMFDATSFQCPVCDLRLQSKLHLVQAGMELVWRIQGVDDPYEIEPEGPVWEEDYSDEMYEAYRDRQMEYEEQQQNEDF